MKAAYRKCVGCKKPFDKKTLIRVAKNGQGELFIDETGKYQSRGAYVCRNISCVAQAAGKKAFERSFKRPVNKNIYDVLKNNVSQQGGAYGNGYDI